MCVLLLNLNSARYRIVSKFIPRPVSGHRYVCHSFCMACLLHSWPLHSDDCTTISTVPACKSVVIILLQDTIIAIAACKWTFSDQLLFCQLSVANCTNNFLPMQPRCTCKDDCPLCPCTWPSMTFFCDFYTNMQQWSCLRHSEYVATRAWNFLDEYLMIELIIKVLRSLTLVFIHFDYLIKKSQLFWLL